MVGTLGTPAREVQVPQPVSRRDMTPTRSASLAHQRSSVTPGRNSRSMTPGRDASRPPRSQRSLGRVPDELPPDYPAMETPEFVMERQKQVMLLAQVPVGEAIRCISVHNGSKVYTGDRSGAIRIRHTQTGDLLTTPNPSDPFSVALDKPGTLPNCMTHTTACGGQIWVGFSDGFVRVFQCDTDVMVGEMLHHTGPVLAIVAEGETLYTAGQDWKINQWSATKMKQVTTYTGHKNAVRSLCMTYECLVSGSDDCTIRLWNAARTSLRGHTGAVLALCAVGPSELWSAGEDGMLAVWGLDSSALLKKLTAHKAPVTCLTAMDGGTLWSADKHGVVIVWDTEQFQMLQRMSPDSADWQKNGITASCAVQRCVSWRVWTCSGDGSVRIWNTPAQQESEEITALGHRLRMVEAHKDTQATQLESLLSAQDTSALRQEIDALRRQLSDQHELLIKGDFRVVEMASETDTLRFEAERCRSFEGELQQERQRRIEADTSASRAEAKMLVLQQECQARAAALQAAEEDRQKHRLHIEKMIDLEREMELECQKRGLAEGLNAELEAGNDALRMTVKELRDALSEASYSSQRQAEYLTSQRASVQRNTDEALLISRSILSSAELDSRALIHDLELHAFLSLERACIQMAQLISTPPPPQEAQGVYDTATLLHTNEMLALRIQHLEASLGEAQQRCVSQAADDQTNVARVQQLEALLAAHTQELSETAAELAQSKCALESLSTELVTQSETNTRLYDVTGTKNKELLESSGQLQKFKHQLEQNIMCITHLEGRLKTSQEEKMALQQARAEMEQEVLAGGEREQALRDAAEVKGAVLAEKDAQILAMRADLDRLLSAHEVLQTEALGSSDWKVRHDQASATHKEEKRLLVRQLGELEAELRKTRTSHEAEVQALHTLADSPVAEAESALASERIDFRAAITELTGVLCERDAQLEILQGQIEAKSEQLNKQTETLGEVVGELTERRRQTNELSARLEDLEIQQRSSEVLHQRQKESVIQSETDLQGHAQKWAAERASLQEEIDRLANNLATLQGPYESTKVQLDTTLREMALLREDSQCEIRMLQVQLTAKNEELLRTTVQSRAISPSASPTPFVMQEDEDMPQHTPMHYTQSYPSFHSRSLSPRPSHPGM